MFEKLSYLHATLSTRYAHIIDGSHIISAHTVLSLINSDINNDTSHTQDMGCTNELTVVCMC